MKKYWLTNNIRKSLLNIIVASGLLAGIANQANAKTFVLPHILEVSGTILNSYSTNTDTVIEITAAKGIGTVTGSGGATVDLYLYDDGGQPLTSPLGTPVCAPCQLTISNRFLRTTVEEIVNAHGGFSSNIITGIAVFDVADTNEGEVSISGFVVDSHDFGRPVATLNVEPLPPPSKGGTNNPSSPKRTFVLPHMLEKSGRAMLGDTNTLDTEILATYGRGLIDGTNAPGATLKLYLYDNLGRPLRGAVNEVCNPCMFDLMAGGGGGGAGGLLKQKISLDDLITTNGGGFGNPNKQGFAIIVIEGNDPDGVSLQGFVVNSHNSPFDLSVFGFEPQPIAAEARIGGSEGTLTPKGTYVVPHILEKSGRVMNTSNTLDTEIILTYTGGLAGITNTNLETIELYLYNDDGTSLRTLPGPLGTITLSQTNRKAKFVIEDLILGNGGFDEPMKTTFAVLLNTSTSSNSCVNIQSFVVNSHSSPFDLSVFGFDPQPIEAAARMAGGDPGTPPPPAPSCRSYILPHILETSGDIRFDSFAVDTTICATYVSSNTASKVTLDLYLRDQFGNVMTAPGGEVCNPCTYNMVSVSSNTPRKLSIRLDDLIVAKGGFAGGVKLGFGIVVVTGGDTDAVNLQTFVVNSHTSPLDLSVFGFDPVPLQAAARFGRPRLQILTPQGAPAPIIAWPTNWPSFTLQAGPDLSSSNWLEIPSVPAGDYFFGIDFPTIPPPQKRFYRLTEGPEE